MKVKQLLISTKLLNAQYNKEYILRYPFNVYNLYDGAVVIVKQKNMDNLLSTFQRFFQKLSEVDSDSIVYYAENIQETPATVRKITLKHFNNGQFYEEKIINFHI